ncbi:DUF2164 domain-containing protein [Acidaminobacter sp. JC074]|uniref:DUF2164 domain-containing protein n=1 Tax=Acidaminobacter sp. JC074 TaxID=2530199 RepID=UPI001F0FD35C|nr:DUF2164 domain-containing protein [Acidaminobacter sp. JC074]MCH4889477.1 DUF2164 domain-containing protein [Acidaminobacter sp. JC074]
MNKIKLTPQIKEKIIDSLRDYFQEERSEDLSHLGADLMLDFILKEVGPMIYNQALIDVHEMMESKIEDIFLLELDDDYKY